MITPVELELALCISLALALVFLAGLLVLFRHSHRDPRWRVFDFNSRQVSEGDVYNVAEIPAIRSVRLVGPRRLRIEFTPPIHTPNFQFRVPGSQFLAIGRVPRMARAERGWTDRRNALTAREFHAARAGGCRLRDRTVGWSCEGRARILSLHGADGG